MSDLRLSIGEELIYDFIPLRSSTAHFRAAGLFASLTNLLIYENFPKRSSAVTDPNLPAKLCSNGQTRLGFSWVS